MIFKYIFLWIILESILLIFFHLLNKVFSHINDETKLTLTSILKGILERIVLIVGLLNDFTEIITAFIALKIAHRVVSNKEKRFDDYFLIGNLVSILAVLTYVLIIR